MERWYHHAELLEREALKEALFRNENDVGRTAKEIGCSTEQVTTAMKKHCIVPEKERSAGSEEEVMLRFCLRGGLM